MDAAIARVRVAPRLERQLAAALARALRLMGADGCVNEHVRSKRR